MSRSSNKQTCTSMFKTHRGYPLERKVMDASGRLGSLYDASTDRLIDRHSCKTIIRKIPSIRNECWLLAGDPSIRPYNALRNIGFDPALRLSIGLQMVTTSGISRVIEYNQPIHENTRFLYYTYRSRKEKINLSAGKAHRLVAAPANGTQATHMITKILWGIEILFVIQLPRNQPVNEIDELLRYIGNELRNNRALNKLNTNARRLISQLTHIDVFGSETCVYQRDSSMLDILNAIEDWKKNENFHQPLIYTMQPLRWLYRGVRFSTIRFDNYANNQYSARIDITINRINHDIKSLGEIFQNLPTIFSSPKLNQTLKDCQRQYRFLLDSQDDLKDRLQRNISDVRRQNTRSNVLDNIISDQRYECLNKNRIETLRNEVVRLTKKSSLIERFKRDGIEYILAVDIHTNSGVPSTVKNVDDILKRSYSNRNVPINLWYSSDRLQLENADKWEQLYQQLKLECQNQVPRFTLVYVDFSYFEQKLDNFTIVRIPLSGPIMVAVEPVANTDSEREKSSHHSSSKSRPTGFRSNSAPTRARKTPTPSKPSKRSQTPSPERKSKRPADGPERSRIHNNQPVTPPRDKKILPVPPHPPQSAVEINVLLLGETGVGKSTFINAFVNYLKFDSLQQAEHGEPIVLIPVSFLLTVGDQFDECIVNFGNADLNEDHEHQGQSVTQQCKSYVFNLNSNVRLRLIDTPGIGDTRGINQDIKNIDHILNYVNSLSHINAICLLLKPNASRLNVFFRSCVKQLLTYLTPVGYNNIIFCFTNARATFYAPGDTGPLLRKMLNDENLHDIPFKKENTFCFDSESFRYLAARKCGVEFDEYQKQECLASWNTSVNESRRLLHFIQRCKQYAIEEWLSPRKAALDISMMARPLMETLRLTIYNMVLTESKLISNQVILHSNSVDIDLCTNCAPISLVEVGPLWCTEYRRPAGKTNLNQHRRCPRNQKHVLIESIVTYNYIQQPPTVRKEKWDSSFRNILLNCDRLVHYLKQQVPSAQEDPFQSIIEHFLSEEQQIIQKPSGNSNMNRKVREVLNSIRRIRQENNQQLFVSNENLSIYELYKIIDELTEIPTVKEQINSIKRTRQLKLAEHEQIVATGNLINKRFLS